MPLTNNAQNVALSYLLSTASGAFAQPTAWYASLHTADPGQSGTSELTSVSASGYARVTIGATGFAVSGTPPAATNPSTVTFTATAAWPAFSYIGLFDNSSAGNFIGSASVVQSGTPYTLAAAGIASGNAGTLYAVNEVVTLSGGTFATAATATVTATGASGAVTGLNVSGVGSYTVLPTDPVSTTSSGSGTGLKIDAFWAQATTTITLNNGDSFTVASGVFSLSLSGQLIFTPS